MTISKWTTSTFVENMREYVNTKMQDVAMKKRDRYTSISLYQTIYL